MKIKMIVSGFLFGADGKGKLGECLMTAISSFVSLLSILHDLTDISLTCYLILLYKKSLEMKSCRSLYPLFSRLKVVNLISFSLKLHFSVFYINNGSQEYNVKCK